MLHRGLRGTTGVFGRGAGKYGAGDYVAVKVLVNQGVYCISCRCMKIRHFCYFWQSAIFPSSRRLLHVFVSVLFQTWHIWQDGSCRLGLKTCALINFNFMFCVLCLWNV